MKEMKFYGTALPGLEIEPYSGKLIVIEGTDGVGRSTHVALLRTWLESSGHAVLDTGMTRSVLAGRGIKNAREGHTLGRLTMLFPHFRAGERFSSSTSSRSCLASSQSASVIECSSLNWVCASSRIDTNILAT